MGSTGCLTQAESPASAMEALISFRKSRRDEAFRPDRSLPRELAMQHLVEAIGLRQFFQAPPILRAALGARQLLFDVGKFQFAGTNCLRLVRDSLFPFFS